MGAYNNLYIEDIAELQREIFEYVAKNEDEIGFDNFVESYMKCKYRVLLDTGNTRVANMTCDEFVSYLQRDCKDVFKHGRTTVDTLQAGWIGRMYSLLQHDKEITSKELYNKLPLERIKILFIPLHTVGEDIALDKLKKAI